MISEDFSIEDDALLPEEEEEVGQEMFEHFRLVADRGQEPIRVDKFIATHADPPPTTRTSHVSRAAKPAMCKQATMIENAKPSLFMASIIAYARVRA